jgi:hypothetical protein
LEKPIVATGAGAGAARVAADLTRLGDAGRPKTGAATTLTVLFVASHRFDKLTFSQNFLALAGRGSHFDDPARKAGAVPGGGVRGGEVPHGFDIFRTQSVEFIEFATGNSIDHNSCIRGSKDNAGASLDL